MVINLDAPTGPISLLRPAGHKRVASSGSSLYQTDLALSVLVNALDLDGRHSRVVNQVLTELETDPDVIAYRQDVLADLLRLPDLAAALTRLLPSLAELGYAGRNSNWDDSSPLVQVTRRLTELENYLLCVDGLAQILTTAAGLGATGWVTLRDFVLALQGDPDFKRLVAELPQLRAQLDQTSSVTLGINLDGQFRPASATVLAVNSTRFVGKGSMLERLLGERNGTGNLRGITGLYKADEQAPTNHQPEHQLFHELSQILERAVQPVLDALQQFSKLNAANLVGLEPELAFWLGAAKLFNKLQAEGYALCRPQIAGGEVCHIKGVYCLDLVLRHQNSRAQHAAKHAASVATPVIANDVDFDSDATIFVLTGPNSGGKTTFTRAIGQAQILFQAGLLLPGHSATLSPADHILTHFATAERPDLEGGRLAEELGRLAQLFQQASRHSLILLNEPLTSTDHTSARALSRDILGGLKLLGARTIYVTHIQELVEDAAQLAEVAPAVHIVSLVAGVSQEQNGQAPTYRITRGQPRGLGYASELARQYGLSLPQISQTLAKKT